MACFPQLPDALEVCRIVASQQAKGDIDGAGPPAQQDQNALERIATVAVKRPQSSSVRAVSA